MKPLIIKLFLIEILLTLLPMSVFAQSNITVTVQDEMGPIPGANVMIKGTTTGAMTDIDGIARLSAKQGDVLVVSFIGYSTEEVTVGNKSTINVTMSADAEILDETIVVGYGTQKKASLTSAITNINAEDIVSTKQANLVSALQGKVPGLQIKQSSGAVGWFDDELSLRGFGEPLVIIDGVARYSKSIGSWGWAQNHNSSSAALGELNPDDIESISVLKDASASIYGIGAQNGVILVTTKKGQIGKPSVSYSNTFTYGVPTALPKEVDIATYMEIENEMKTNHRESPRFDAETIAKYRAGGPGYENHSWYDDMYKDHTFSQTHNLSVRGGNQQTQYYLSGNLTNQDAIYRADTGDYNRYSLTGNFTANITENLSVMFQSQMTITKHKLPYANSTQNAQYYALLSERYMPSTSADGHYTDCNGEHRNPVALFDSETSGAQIDNSFSLRNNLDIKYKAPWVKGLDFQVSGAYDYTSRTSHLTFRHFPLYNINDELVNYNPDKNQISENWRLTTRYYTRAQANYRNTFARNHTVGATLAAEATINQGQNLSGGRQYGDFFTHDILDQGQSSTATNGGSRNSSMTIGYVGRINYDYKGKYLVEVMARYDGTYMYGPGKRFGLFPSYSLGWRVSDEKFFKALFPKINNFKLRWSDGKTGQAQGSPYNYLPGYSTSGSYIFTEGSSVTGYASTTVPQTLISWADVRMMDFGFDLEVWQGKLGATVDWFWREITGIASASTATVPDFYGLGLPQVNQNASEDVGIDLTLSHRNRIGDFNYRIQFNATYSRKRQTFDKKEETKIYTSADNYYTSHTIGRWSDARSYTTYHWLPGNPQFTGWDDIADYPVMHGSYNDMLPGMYKISDRDGNGVINNNDRYYAWGERNSPLQLGLVLSGSYKNFDFNMSFTSSLLGNKSVSLSSGTGYGFFKTFYENYLDRWHLADGYIDPFDPSSKWIPGTFPALSTATAAYDTSSNATYRINQPYNYINSSFVRLKSIEVGYTFKASFLKKINVRSLRVYANGSNIFTICNKFLKPYDPERNTSSYLGVAGNPLMRNFAAGINLNF